MSDNLTTFGLEWPLHNGRRCRIALPWHDDDLDEGTRIAALIRQALVAEYPDVTMTIASTTTRTV